MPSIFTRIMNGEIPCHELASDERFFSFLDINPVHEGHALVVPRREVDHLFDLRPEELAGIMDFAAMVSRKIKAVVPCTRIGLTVIGLEVPHAHIHLVPIDALGDMDFTKPRLRFTAEEFAALADRIRRA